MGTASPPGQPSLALPPSASTITPGSVPPIFSSRAGARWRRPRPQDELGPLGRCPLTLPAVSNAPGEAARSAQQRVFPASRAPFVAGGLILQLVLNPNGRRPSWQRALGFVWRYFSRVESLPVDWLPKV